jgi:hypothetical protein
METTIKGYQYKMPPNTTLVAPPAIPEGKEALWGGKSWRLVNEEIITSIPNGN